MREYEKERARERKQQSSREGSKNSDSACSLSIYSIYTDPAGVGPSEREPVSGNVTEPANNEHGQRAMVRRLKSVRGRDSSDIGRQTDRGRQIEEMTD